MSAVAKRWTLEEVEKLRLSYRTEPAKVIAEELGLSYDCVRDTLRRYGLERKTMFSATRVQGPAQSLIDREALIESRRRIASLIFEETNMVKAEKLTAIYRDLNVIINRSL